MTAGKRPPLPPHWQALVDRAADPTTPDQALRELCFPVEGTDLARHPKLLATVRVAAASNPNAGSQLLSDVVSVQTACAYAVLASPALPLIRLLDPALSTWSAAARQVLLSIATDTDLVRAIIEGAQGVHYNVIIAGLHRNQAYKGRKLIIAACAGNESSLDNGTVGLRQLRWIMQTVAPGRSKLVLVRQRLGDEAARLIANHPNAAHLDTLHLRSCDITQDGVAMLLRSPYLQKLKSLDVSGHPVWEGVFDPLSKRDIAGAYTVMPHLEALDFTTVGPSCFAPARALRIGTSQIHRACFDYPSSYDRLRVCGERRAVMQRSLRLCLGLRTHGCSASGSR